MMISKIKISLLALLLALGLGGCQRDELSSTESSAQGALALTITRADQATSAYDDITLRIYNSSDKLIARYTADQIPEAIYLAEASYRATVCSSEQVEMSDSVEAIYYYGEQEFTVEGGKVSTLEINCTIQNTIVEVNFDESVFERFELEALCYLSLCDEFSLDAAAEGSVPTLQFDSDGYGYFILPEGVDNIAWGFYGLSAEVDYTAEVQSTTAQFSGVIESPQPSTKYTLNFVYTYSPDGYMILNVTLDEGVEEFDDFFGFSPQPTIKANGFSLEDDALSFTGDDLLFDIESISDISRVEIYSEEFAASSTIVVMEDGAPLETLAEALYTPTDTKSGVLALRKELFADFAGYGTKNLSIIVTDNSNSVGSCSVSILVSGLLAPSLDLWNNSAELSAELLLDDVGSVTFALSESGSEEWREVEATLSEDGLYRATIEASWSESLNAADLTIYTPVSGVWAGGDYRCKMIVDGVEYAPITVSAAEGQQITNGDMESSSIKAFSTSSSSSTDWASGNNTFTSDLCSQVSKGGSNCAYLQSKTAVGVFAAGNLNYGQFEMSGFSGSMRFGQELEWVSRPKALRFRYAATIGDETHDDYDLLDGKDKARVYFAIVDWSDRHTVTAGTSGNPTGAWDPASQTLTEEGNIIGYASLFIEESTQGDELYSVTVPIEFYDYLTKPEGPISIVLSCAASAYGDYMTGSTSSRLWVDDFELVY